MIILYFLASIPMVMALGWYIRFCADTSYRLFNGKDIGIIFAFLACIFPFIVLIQILVWTGVLK